MGTIAILNELFEAARQGDRVSIVQVLQHAQPDIRRYARATCKTSADVEDAVQEVLWILNRRIAGIRALSSLPHWLFIVVRRQCLRLARRARSWLTGGEDMLESALDMRSDTVLQLEIAAAFEALPPQLRDVALLRDVKGLAIGEISVELGLTREATKARLHRARMLLREYLAE